jgi:dihydrolipoamide dehydrogenase
MSAYDVVVIGAGPGGYVAAIRAAQLGLRTAVVENKHLGGVCLNWGCIPTKALLRSAEVYRLASHGEAYGLKAGGLSIDLAAVVSRSRRVSGQLNAGVTGLLEKNKVDVIWGRASIPKVGTVSVAPAKDSEYGKPNPPPKAALGAGEYLAKHIIVATGAQPRVLPGMEPDGKLVWTYVEAMAPAVMPKSLLVVGSGAIGIEFASFYGAMSAEVTVVEVLPQVLPIEDHEIAALAEKSFEKQGINLLLGAKVTALKKGANDVTATVELADGSRKEIKVDRVISAVGVVGNIDNLGLESLGVKTDHGCVTTDGLGRTNVAGIYAIGDVAGPPMLAHKAEHEGVLVVEAIAGKPVRPIDKRKIPGCTYSNPQVASVGLTEKQANEAGYDVKIGRFPFVGNGKAIALGEPDGLVKTIFDAKTGQLLGAHMIGAEVTELIQGFVVAMQLETTEEDLMHAVFPHPTLSEAMQESVLSAYGRAIHI